MVSYVWDFLRPFTTVAHEFALPIKFLILLLSLALLFISFLAYRKAKSRKFLFIALAFAFFAIKWTLKIVDIFLSPGLFLADATENIFELLIFVSLFLALFKK